MGKTVLTLRRRRHRKVQQVLGHLGTKTYRTLHLWFQVYHHFHRTRIETQIQLELLCSIMQYFPSTTSLAPQLCTGSASELEPHPPCAGKCGRPHYRAQDVLPSSSPIFGPPGSAGGIARLSCDAFCCVVEGLSDGDIMLQGSSSWRHWQCLRSGAMGKK